MRADLKRLKRDSSGHGSRSRDCRQRSGGVGCGGRDASGLPARHRRCCGTQAASRRSGAFIVLAVSLIMIGAGAYGLYNKFAQWRGDSGPIPFQNMTMEKLTNSGQSCWRRFRRTASMWSTWWTRDTAAEPVDASRRHRQQRADHARGGSLDYRRADVLAQRRLSLLRTRRPAASRRGISLPDSGAGRHAAQAGGRRGQRGQLLARWPADGVSAQ